MLCRRLSAAPAPGWGSECMRWTAAVKEANTGARASLLSGERALPQEALVADVLAQLADCLVDSCSAVVQAAQRTLRSLLHTPVGASALARLQEPARSYAGVFAPTDAAAADGVPLLTWMCTFQRSDGIVPTFRCQYTACA